jgi:Tfp pilus assembly protein PilV
LIEVMIAMTVLAFGLLGIAAIQVHAIHSRTGGQSLSEASAVARTRIEQLSRLAFASAALTDSGNSWVNSTHIQTSGQTFVRAERITNDGTELKELEVRVDWNDGLRSGRSVVLTSKKLKEPDE